VPPLSDISKKKTGFFNASCVYDIMHILRRNKNDKSDITIIILIVLKKSS
jgi:hypothetical protein